MSAFKRWWAENADGRTETPLMKACFYGGYVVALQSVIRIVLGVSVISLVALMMTGCQDHYRYPCQNPDNFYKEECQKPKCLFTQQCPEYLVAPILEKQINATQPQQPASEASANR